MDKISVIIPIFNSSSYIKRCLDCITGQSYPNLEIILINDGSTDNSLSLCKDYALKDDRIKIINQENRGVAEARNTGLKVSSGNYVAFIDIDDIVHPDYFSILMQAIQSGEYDMASCLYQSLWEQDLSGKEGLFSNYDIISTEKSKYFWLDGMLAIPIEKSRKTSMPFEMVWAKIYRKELVENIYFENLWGEDQEFNSKIYSRLNNSILVQSPLYIWVQNNNSAHRADPHSNYTSFLECTDKIYNNIPFILPHAKSKALKRAWLGLLSTRFLISSDKKYNKKKKENLFEIKSKANKLKSPLIHSKYIPIYFKTGILLFYYLPIFYTLFRWSVPRILKIKNYFNYQYDNKIKTI